MNGSEGSRPCASIADASDDQVKDPERLSPHLDYLKPGKPCRLGGPPIEMIVYQRDGQTAQNVERMTKYT